NVPQDTLSAAHRAYGEQQPANRMPPLRNDRDPNRRLRVALLSTDFHEHSVAYFIEALFAGIDRHGFELYCYHLGAARDARTARFAARADRWRQAHRTPPPALAAQIRADAVDVVIDLAGHTSGDLAALNSRCAPVQVTWLGYPTTSGRVTMDYRISD